MVLLLILFITVGMTFTVNGEKVMFSNEFEFDKTIITVMDDTGAEEDVVVELGDDHVDIRQYSETLGKYDLITMTPKMMFELLEAFNRPTGLFQVELQQDPLR